MAAGPGRRVCAGRRGCVWRAAGWFCRACGGCGARRAGAARLTGLDPPGGQGESGRVADRAANRVKRGDEGQPQRISVGQVGCCADQLADRVVGAQQCPQFLFGAVGGLRAQHDTVAFELGLERAEGVLDLPAGVVELGQLGRRGGVGVQQRGQQRERLRRAAAGVEQVVLHHPDGDRLRAGPALVLRRRERGQVRPVGQDRLHGEREGRPGPPQQVRAGRRGLAPQVIAWEVPVRQDQHPLAQLGRSSIARAFSEVA